MGRSKKNWDHLVDSRGNYGIDVLNGIFPGSDGNNVKGTKGSSGEKGNKGQKGYQGEDGKKGDTGFGLPGQKGDPGTDGTSLDFDSLTQSQKDELKGEAGPQGDKGDEGLAPALFFKGAVDTVGLLPVVGQTDGDTYYVIDENEYYAAAGTNWFNVGNAIKGEKGPVGEKGQGEKGDRGVQGEKGLTGDPGLDGAPGADGDPGKDAFEIAVEEGFTGSKNEWLISLKGEKGDDGSGGGSGDSFDADAYYDKVSIDQMVAGLEVPERAFDYYFHNEYPDNVLKSNVDFLTTDRNNHLYDLGCVLVEGGVKAKGAPPFTNSTDMLVINYALKDPMGSRSAQYQLLQFVYARTAENKFEGFMRRAQPERDNFTDWSPTVFNEGLYYTKREVDNAIASQGVAKSYVVRPQPGDDTNEARVQLHVDGTAGADDTDVIFRGENGIAISRQSGKIVIDGAALNGIEYIGPIGYNEDPNVKEPSPELGQFFIFSNGGTAYDGTVVGPGDWIIWSGPGTPEWKYIFVGGENGVLSIEATGALTKSGTETNPVIDLDPDLYLENADVPETLQPYSKWSDITKLAALRKLGTLSDVEAGQDLMGPGGSYATYVDRLPAEPLTGGSYFTDLPNQVLIIGQNDQYIRPVQDMFDAILLDDTEIRVQASDLSFDLRSKVLEKIFDGRNFMLKLDNPEIPRTLALYQGTFLINHTYGFETPDGSYLQYNETLGKWYPSVNDWLSEAYADTKYVINKSDEMKLLSDAVIIKNKADDGDTSLTVFGNTDLVGNVEAKIGAFEVGAYAGTNTSPFVGFLDHALVTNARLKIAIENAQLSGGGSGGGGGGNFDGDTITLKNTMTFDDGSVNYANFKAIGSANKQFVFTVQDGLTSASMATVMTVQKGRVNLNGGRLMNVGDATSPGDALTLKRADEKYLPKSSPGADLSLSSSKFNVNTDTFKVVADGKDAIKTDDKANAYFTSPRSTRPSSDKTLLVDELAPRWYIDQESASLKDQLTVEIDKKPSEAPKNGKQYARKDGAWNEVIIPETDVSNLVEEAPNDNKEYGRKKGKWVALTSTTSVGNLPSNPNRGTIYLTNGNVLAIGL